MIDSFSGKYAFLSNFYRVPIIYQDRRYPTTEHAFQAAKTLNEDSRIQIAHTKDPADAKRLGRRVTLRPHWNTLRDIIMYEICQIKFTNKALRRMLLDTGSEELVEGNTWNDTYWGVCRGQGQNKLGKILMKIREDLQKEFKDGQKDSC